MITFASIFPKDVSTTGYKIDSLFYLTLWETGIAFLLVLGILFFFIVRYRQRYFPKAFYTHGNRWPHLVLTGGLALAVFVFIDLIIAHLSARVWGELRENRPPLDQSVQVKVLAQQYAWNFKYPGLDRKYGTADDIDTVNQLYIPVHQNVVVELHSKDVIHSFFLPNFRIKQDAVPGMTTELWFEATTTGQFEIACAELCWLGHYRMRGIMTVQTKEEFEEWMKEQDSEKTVMASEEEW